MNPPIIIDSSAFISLGTVTDSNYQTAVAFSKGIAETNRTTIMPGEIFTEIVNVAGQNVSHQAAVDQAYKILSQTAMVIAETNSNIRRKALEKFEKQPQSVSFTDC